MTTDPYLMPKEMGVVSVDGHSEPVIYRVAEVFEKRRSAYHAAPNGEMTVSVPTGLYGIVEARYLGLPPLPLSLAIRTAVRADCAKRGIELAEEIGA